MQMTLEKKNENKKKESINAKPCNKVFGERKLY